MSSEQISEANSPELDAISRRVAARKLARQAELVKKQAEDELNRHLLERALRAKNKSAPVVAPPLRTILYRGFLSIIKSKVLHRVLAYSSLAVMIGGLGSYSYKFISEQIEAAYRDHCAEHHMKYASGSRMYCYDDGRFAHAVTDDGVTGRLVADWGVNDRQLRLGAKAYEHANGPVARPTAGPVAKPKASFAAKPAAGFAAKPVEGPASALAVGSSARTIAGLAAQIMRN
jgi:hypothetical protein